MKRITLLLLAAASCMVTGCAGQQNTPEYSVVIVDATKTGAVSTVSVQTESAAPPTEPTTASTATESVQTTQSAAITTAKTTKTTAKTSKTAGQTTASGYLLTEPLTSAGTATTTAKLNADGSYTTKEDVSLYIYTYGKLPKNFITKKEAQELGWNGGSLEPYAKGCSIGGSAFGNYEGKLPKKKGRSYYECDIDTRGKSSRGAKRIVYSNDGLVYYTEDHYQTFVLLYGEVT